MHKLQIETSQNVGIEYPTASLVERIFAYLIDLIIITAYAIMVWVIVDGFADPRYSDTVYMVLVIPVYVFYHFAFEYFNNGRSPGKMIFKLKVMHLDGSRPTLGSYFTRWLIGLIEFNLFLGSPAMFFIMFTKRSQRIGDIAANTTVIKKKLLTMGKHLSDKQFAADYEPEFPRAKLFSDKQAEVINSVLTNPVSELRNRQIVQLADKIKDEFAIFDNSERPPKEFLIQLLDDYAYYFWEEENLGQISALQQDISKVLS